MLISDTRQGAPKSTITQFPDRNIFENLTVRFFSSMEVALCELSMNYKRMIRKDQLPMMKPELEDHLLQLLKFLCLSYLQYSLMKINRFLKEVHKD